ncbi:hypothetical protein [Aeromicrobium sp. 179-A 4D2 NHS]|uniref:hypothetical protein n=1 Tax=Aeromicrobium sp. 179-A 4D2 NHS TaxID=3142375 RepID=UPI0039A33240
MSMFKRNNDGDRRDPLFRVKHKQPGVPHKNIGQTAELERGVSTKSLIPDADPWQERQKESVRARAERLIEDGYVAAGVLVNSGDVRSTRDREDWWDKARLTAEYAPAGVPQMPDDNTPMQTAGAALSGSRRTHRVKYEGKNGFALRMPSNTALNRYADELEAGGKNSTFDVPVHAVGPSGNTIQGWVRASRLGPNRWSTSFVTDPSHDSKDDTFRTSVAEAVSAIAEARRGQIQSALVKVDDLMERHAERERTKGVTLQEVQSNWITGAAYDEANAQIHIAASGKDYVYKDVSREEAEMLLTARSAGSVFHQIIGRGRKQVKEGAGVSTQCGSCKRFAPPNAKHMCPSGLHASPTAAGAEANARAREAAKRTAMSKGSLAAAARMVRPVSSGPSTIPTAE